MKKRLTLVLKGTLAVTVLAACVIAFPLWGILWIVVGWSAGDWFWKYLDPVGWEEDAALMQRATDFVEEMREKYNLT